MKTIDDCNDLVFILVNNNEELATKWWFAYNTELEARPVDLIEQRQEDKIYSYLHYYVYGPY